MDPEHLQQAWQSQPIGSQIPLDTDALLKEVRVCRRVERLNGTLVRRDVVETMAAVFVIFFFGRYSYAAPADQMISRIGAGFLVGWAVFIICKMHRTRTIERPAPLNAPVREFCRVELNRLDRQIRLLRSVLWWYIAPCMIGANVMFIGMAGLGVASLTYGFATFLLGWGLYALNMRAVAKELLPAREELVSLLNQLDGGSVVEQPAEPPPKPRRRFGIVVLLVALLSVGTVAALLVREPKEYSKRAPFAGIRWEGEQPVVKIGDEWFKLVSIDGISAADIVAFSRWTYMDRWRKRFAEDLVEVLTRMGHAPDDTVDLVVLPLGSDATRILKDVPMTEANRSAIYESAGAP